MKTVKSVDISLARKSRVCELVLVLFVSLLKKLISGQLLPLTYTITIVIFSDCQIKKTNVRSCIFCRVSSLLFEIVSRNTTRRKNTSI